MAANHVNDVFKVRMPFVDENGDPADPESVTFKFRLPDRSVLTYVYDTDAEVVRESEGVFYCEQLLTQAGLWTWRVEGSGGDAAAADENTFEVLPSVFYP